MSDWKLSSCSSPRQVSNCPLEGFACSSFYCSEEIAVTTKAKSKFYGTSDSVEWATPQYVFDQLNEEFDFTLDPCASDENHKCAKYYTIEDDGLEQNWDGERVFMNPPFGRNISLWVKKISESICPVAVALIPAKTDTVWFHKYVLEKAEIRCIKGRVKYVGNSVNSAPFVSILAVYRKGKNGAVVAPGPLRSQLFSKPKRERQKKGEQAVIKNE
jgi:phage N-6-adenine-methyltransferase